MLVHPCHPPRLPHRYDQSSPLRDERALRTRLLLLERDDFLPDDEEEDDEERLPLLGSLRTAGAGRLSSRGGAR